MAEEIIFNVGVNTGRTPKDLDDINDSLENINDTVQGASKNLNKTFDDLNARVESGTLTMRESAKAIKDYQTIALQAGRESPIGQEALQRAGELKDKLGDLKTEINNLGTDGANMKAALQLGSTITAGYGALTGAQALLGTESETLTKTLVKLQAVQAILAAIEEVRVALEKESILMQKAKVIQTNILSAATAAYTVVVGASTGAMKAMRIAMLSIPIVAVVAGIAALVSIFSDWNSETTALEIKQQALTDTLDEYKNAATEATQKTNEVKNAFQLAKEGVISKGEALKIYNDTLGGTFGAAKDLNEAERLFIAKTDAYVKASALRAQADAILKIAAEEKVKAMVADIDASKQAAKESSNIFASSLNDATVTTQKEVSIKSKAKAKELENLSASLIKEAELIENSNNIKSETEQAYNAEVETRRKENDKNEIEDTYDKNAKELEAYKRRLEDERNLQLAEDAWKLEQETLANEAQVLKDQTEQAREQELSAFRIGIWENELAEEKRIEEEKVKAHEESQQRKIQIAQDYAGAVNALAGGIFALSNTYGKQDEKAKEERAKRQFKVQKALNLGMAIIDGYKAITASLSQSPVAIGPIPNPAGIASLAFATATSLANVAKIASAKYEGGMSGGNISVAPPSTVPNTPNPQLANADTTLTSGLSGNTNNQGGGKVFVVDSEITAKQNQTAQTLSIATVG